MGLFSRVEPLRCDGDERMAERKGRKKSKQSDLPDWAITLWKDAGEPDLSPIQDVLSGPLLDRRCGLRRDDLIEILLDARALPKGMDPMMQGRLIGTNKSSIELLTSDLNYHYLARDVIVDVVLIAHMRPPYIEDRELLDFERDDMKRRNSLHEEVEKGSTGGDDSHVWG
uniref:Uncharacterized protein n=1 Tax=uncultured marine group II/III euryarchaeote KM3_41_F08 TaxID=1456446 RepID=A0A075H5Z8_9EURY|nr:hypothetical protein [uncultured marine group II/III euryarchaeote KM3_41_F08]